MSAPDEDTFALPNVESTLGSRLEQAFGEGCDPAIRLDPDEGPRDPTAARLASLARGGPRSARYEFRGHVGRGGMGAVLKVWDSELRRKLAMKVMLAQEQVVGERRRVSPEDLARFLEEAQITGQLDHPGVVPVHELGVDGEGQVYFTMRLVRGRDLREVFRDASAERGGWTQPRAVGVLLKVCETMAYAHDSGVVHRDLKPANVMVGDYGEVYVMDWGLAKVLARARGDEGERASAVRTDRTEAARREARSPLSTADGAVVGTPAFMPPEQADGRMADIGPACDVYAVGAMLYDLLTGRAPYTSAAGHDVWDAVLQRVLHGPPPSLFNFAPSAPPLLAAICERAMARDPRERYASMRAMADDLQAWLEGRVVRAFSRRAPPEPKGWLERHRRLAAGLALAWLLALVALVALIPLYVSARSQRAEARAREAALRDELELARATADARVEGLLERILSAPGEAGAEAFGSASAAGSGDLLAGFVGRAASEVRAELADEPARRAADLEVLGRLAHVQGRHEQAWPLLAEALAILRDLSGEDDPSTRAVLAELVGSLVAAARFEDAEPRARELLEIAPSDDPRRAEYAELLASIEAALGDEPAR